MTVPATDMPRRRKIFDGKLLDSSIAGAWDVRRPHIEGCAS